MPFQSSVNVYQTPGIAGDFFDDSPRRVHDVITSGAIVGNAATYINAASDPMKVQGGGSDGFAGIIVNGKELLRTSGLSAGLSVKDNSVAPICQMGRVWVTVKNDVTVGYVAAFDSSTGDLYGYATSAAATSGGKVVIPNGTFEIVNATSGTLAVLELGK